MTDHSSLADVQARYGLTAARTRHLCLLELDPENGYRACQKYMRQHFVRLGLAEEWRDHPDWGQIRGGFIIRLSPEGRRVVDLLKPTWNYRSLLLARLTPREAREQLTPEEYRFFEERWVRVARATQAVARVERLVGRR